MSQLQKEEFRTNFQGGVLPERSLVPITRGLCNVQSSTKRETWNQLRGLSIGIFFCGLQAKTEIMSPKSRFEL